MRVTCLAGALSLLLIACGAPGSLTTPTSAPRETTPAEPGEELASARERWSQAGLASYRFQFEDDCGECDPSMRLPTDVVVWEGDATPLRQPTIETLFDHIGVAIGEGREVEVSYDQELGHPTEISIDMADRAFDGGTHWIIRSLEPGLPGEDVSLAGLEAALAIWKTKRPAAYEFRTSIDCDCSLAGTIWTKVEGTGILDWKVEFEDGAGGDISPITVDDMFSDLAGMLSSSEGIVEEGVRFTGSAKYDPELGYPVWIGLDIEVLDPGSQLAFLPPRLVFSVYDFLEVNTAESSQPGSDFESARKRWAASGIEDYQYQLTVHDIEEARISEPYVITVEAGVTVSVEQGGRPVDDPDLAATIDDLFDEIAPHIDSGSVVEGLYHDELGYPVLIAVRQSDRSADVRVISIDELIPGR